MEALRIAYLALGAVLTACAVWFVHRSKRRLDERIREFRREQAERTGPPPDPWQELAALYAAEEAERRARGKTRKQGR